MNFFVVQLVFRVASFRPPLSVLPLSDSMSLSVFLSFVLQASKRKPQRFSNLFFFVLQSTCTMAASMSTPFVLSNVTLRGAAWWSSWSSPGRHRAKKAPGDAPARQSPSPGVKVHASEPYGASKVSALPSPIDTWRWPRARCLPTPLASPLNIENRATY